MLAAARPHSIAGPESPKSEHSHLPPDPLEVAGHALHPPAGAIELHDLDSMVLADVGGFDRSWMLGTWHVAWSTLPMWKVCPPSLSFADASRNAVRRLRS